MRDPDRIEKVLAELRMYWVDNPDLRLCQIIGNFFNTALGHAYQLTSPDYVDVKVVSHMTSNGYNAEDDLVLRYLQHVNGLVK